MTIFAQEEEAVRACAEECEYRCVRIPISRAKVDWARGKTQQGADELDNIQRKTRINNIEFNQKTRNLELTGISWSVEDAQAMVESHLQYYDVYQDMHEEMG